MSQRTSTQRRSWKERALSLLLAAALLTSLIPGLALPASAEHWADAYLDQLVDWGVMRADQTANPDADLTRAEFFAIINRAYGYTERGYIPFEDVLETDWFYDDISIAYTAGYMAGTSPTTASPNDSLTREQAFCILGRNMMLQDAPGESLAFADSRDVSDWARGTIKAAADNYIVSGFPDNTLHPQDFISKGQMAVLVSQCLGTPIQESGTYDLGGVFGNVTITAPNVTLRNATISGDLYISGGVGLGGIKLENVDVLGRIIVSGTGESEGGDASVIMRNVTADEMLVDNMRNKTVTIRADGITNIANTIVRTNAYLEDNNTDEEGLLRIELDGDPGTRLTLAGRIKEVVNKTPSSYIQAAKGTVAKLTVDEAATNSTVQIDRNTKINVVNLDVATSVLGDGDIGQLNINAPGSVVTMLPDKIYVRPGLTASIAGVIMDYQAAEEGSLDPRLLSGYPAAKDIAPTGFRADFAGNKKGTIYWAVSYVSDGSIGEDDLISPPSYGSKAIANGSVAEPAGGDEVSAQVGNLVVGGSYYLSAILVDEQKERSPVKVISFSTPDNTVPAFAQGYPYMSRTTRSVAQVTVMPTKSCKLYYALLPDGAKAPTVNELKAAAVAGNLGYGVRDVTKNTEEVFTVNSQRLEELKTYVLYLWLTDVDGINSSAVQSLSFTIPDETPPEFVSHPDMNGTPQATSIPMAATLNENGTIYWVVVEAGTAYPPIHTGYPDDNEIGPDGEETSAKLESTWAKLCVQNGTGVAVVQRGQVAAQANMQATMNITGLQAEKAYDLYYLAIDTAGNYTVQVYKLNNSIHTLDTTGPVVTQSFGSLQDPNNPNKPLASTDIWLDFTEDISSGRYNTAMSFLTLYNEAIKKNDMTDFVNVLKNSILLFHYDANADPTFDPVMEWTYKKTYTDEEAAKEPVEWVDYSNVIVEATATGIRITFPGSENRFSDPAVKLRSGEQYYFEFYYINDTATPPNQMHQYHDVVNYSNANDNGYQHRIPIFETVFSQVTMRNLGPNVAPKAKGKESGKNPDDDEYARMDAYFRLSPVSTSGMNDSHRYDILIYNETPNTPIEFDLYYRITDKSTGNGIIAEGPNVTNPLYEENLLTDHTTGDGQGAGPDEKGWYYLGSTNGPVWGGNGVSVGNDFLGAINNANRDYPQLNKFSEELYYEFAISITRNGVQTEYKNFSDPITLKIYVEAGSRPNIADLGSDPSQRQGMEDGTAGSGYVVTNIGWNPDPNALTPYLEIIRSFPNTDAPIFVNNAPWFRASETAGEQIVDTKYEYVDDNGNSATGYVDTTLVGSSSAHLFLNMNLKGTIWYVVSRREYGQLPTLLRTNADGTTDNITGDDVWKMVPTSGSDTQLPAGTRVSLPDVTTLTDRQRTLENTDGVDAYGSIPYSSEWSTQRFEVTGLIPETDYYIYFVLESEREGATGKRSEAYVYKFRTDEAARPKIRLEPDIFNGVADVFTPNTDSTLTYLIYTQSDAENNKIEPKILNEYLIDHLDPGKTLPTTYEDLTILEALITDYRDAAARAGNDNEKNPNAYFPPGTSDNVDYYSVFDFYASEKIKGDIYDLIRASPRVGSPVNGDTGVGNRTVTIPQGNESLPLNSTPVGLDGTNHVVLVMGRNPAIAEGTIRYYSFKAVANVSVVDQTLPQLVEIGSSASIHSSPDGGATFTGTVALHFEDGNGHNKNLYWASNTGQTPLLVHQGCGGTHDGCIDLLSPEMKIGKSDRVILTDNATQTTGVSTLRLNFSNLPLGEYVTIVDNGILTNASGRQNAGKATFRVVPYEDGYRIEVTWGDRPVFYSPKWPSAASTQNQPKLQNVTKSGDFEYDEGTGGVTGTFTLTFNNAIYHATSYGADRHAVLGMRTTSSTLSNPILMQDLINPSTANVEASGKDYPDTAFDFKVTNLTVPADGNTPNFTLFKSSEYLANGEDKANYPVRQMEVNVALVKGAGSNNEEGVWLRVTVNPALSGESFPDIWLCDIPDPPDEPEEGASLVPAKPPVLLSVSAPTWTVDPYTRANTVDLTLTFNQPIYYKTGDTTTPVTTASLAAAATYTDANGKAGTASVTPYSGGGDNYTLRLTSVKAGTITLPSQTFYDKTGRASTTGAITIKISDVVQVNSVTGLAPKASQLTVSFGNVSKTIQPSNPAMK